MLIDDVFAVIAEATRRDILVSLQSGDKAVGELVEELEASQPTISKHLKVLREAQLVTMRAQGQKRFYALNTEPLQSVAAWLETFDAGRTASAKGTDSSAAATSVQVPGETNPSAPNSASTSAASASSSTSSIPAQTTQAPPSDSPAAGVELSPATLAQGVANGDTDPSVQQQFGRSVGRAATKAADLIANLPKFGRRK
ncbi:ArsR/SmtB family transcription factor [Pseudarthrobacter sp. J1738]|uniref:ArsR/SmtB family transcription factor n=1 Tax=unclassified Pseudarthrobacter TaxID=2647000 RepID=UPI003D2CED00